MNREAIIQCDACKRPFSFGIVRNQIMQEGEFQINYFRCPLCGEKYHITTTDTAQREMLEELNRMIRRRMLGGKKKLKLKTLNRMLKEEKSKKRRFYSVQNGLTE